MPLPLQLRVPLMICDAVSGAVSCQFPFRLDPFALRGFFTVVSFPSLPIGISGASLWAMLSRLLPVLATISPLGRCRTILSRPCHDLPWPFSQRGVVKGGGQFTHGFPPVGREQETEPLLELSFLVKGNVKGWYMNHLRC